MYDQRILLATATLFSDGVDEDNFPKVIGDYPVATLQEQQNVISQGVPSDAVVITPNKTIDLVIGRDYVSCILEVPGTSYTKVLFKEIPSPVLNETLDVTPEGSPILEWSFGYKLPTYIFRTDVFETGGEGLGGFKLIARIPGGTVPGGTVTYTDTSIELLDDTESVSYYVVNNNGKSQVITYEGIFDF